MFLRIKAKFKIILQRIEIAFGCRLSKDILKERSLNMYRGFNCKPTESEQFDCSYIQRDNYIVTMFIVCRRFLFIAWYCYYHFSTAIFRYSGRHRFKLHRPFQMLVSCLSDCDTFPSLLFTFVRYSYMKSHSFIEY